METNKRRFWHYTSAFRLPQILSSGKIILDPQAKAYGEKPAAWVSTNPEWEYTVLKTGPDGTILSKDELDQLLGLGRIEIKPSPRFISWNKFKKTSGINKMLWRRMTQFGREKGANPNEWYASYIPIISKYFMSVEMYINGKWVKCEDWNNIHQFVIKGMEANKRLFCENRFGIIKKAA